MVDKAPRKTIKKKNTESVYGVRKSLSVKSGTMGEALNAVQTSDKGSNLAGSTKKRTPRKKKQSPPCAVIYNSDEVEEKQSWSFVYIFLVSSLLALLFFIFVCVPTK
jgi:hypothetical protein